MQSFIIFFIIVYALHISGGFSTHHQNIIKSCILLVVLKRIH